MISAAAAAHGYWPPKHEGVVNDGETTFELVARERQIVIYFEDHGTLIPTEGATGTFTVIRGPGEEKAELSAAGDNRMTARISSKLEPGDRIMAKITLGNGSVVVGRFLWGADVTLQIAPFSIPIRSTPSNGAFGKPSL